MQWNQLIDASMMPTGDRKKIEGDATCYSEAPAIAQDVSQAPIADGSSSIPMDVFPIGDATVVLEAQAIVEVVGSPALELAVKSSSKQPPQPTVVLQLENSSHPMATEKGVFPGNCPPPLA